MKVIYDIILFYLITIVHNETVETVVNSCGLVGYNEPKDSSECKEKGEYCCFVHIEGESNGKKINKKFCVTSPSDIKINEVKNDIESYTKLELKELVCNNSLFIKVSFYLFLLILFI